MSQYSLLQLKVREYVEYFSLNASCHGSTWVSQIKSGKLRIIYVVLMIGLQFCIFLFVLPNLFNPERGIYTSFFKLTEEFIPYPNYTVCNPRMFDKKKVQALNLSSTLLTYIYFSMNPHTDSIYGFILQLNKTNQSIESLDKEFRNHPISNISDIFNYLAIRCEDFIPLCYHTLQRNKWSDCCNQIFDSKPFFSSAGVCFTTKPYDLPRVSEVLRPDKIILNVAEDYSEGINITLGSPFNALPSAKMAFHSNDHGLVAIDKQDISLAAGNTYQYKIDIHRDDRSGMKEVRGMSEEYISLGMCIGKDESVDMAMRSLGYPGWSEDNCRSSQLDLISVNCSLSKTKGFEQINMKNNERVEKIIHNIEKSLNISLDAPLCTPFHLKDYIQNITTDNEFILHFEETILSRIAELCSPKCNSIRYELSRSVTKLPESFNNRIFIQSRLSSRAVTTYKIAPKSFGAILSELGGLMGMLIGASWITIGELFVFYVGFFVLLLKFLCCPKILRS